MTTGNYFSKTGGLFLMLLMLFSIANVGDIFAAQLDPTTIPQYEMPLVKPPAMPPIKSNNNKDKYKIAVRQFQQHILPPSMGLPTTVWSYGSANDVNPDGTAKTVTQGGTYFYPAFTIEAEWNKDVQVQWGNELVDPLTGNFLPHILPVDQTLHWANPPGGINGRDTHGTDPNPYLGPVPMITHVHGAHTFEDSDGYPEAWYLPAANNIPAGYALTGTYFDVFNAKYGHNWSPGTATFKYPNNQRATTLWYHDHTLGMTRVNVYAGPAGFYLIRGGPDDVVTVQGTGWPNGTLAVLPGPAPGMWPADPFGIYYEIPIVIQDRSFNADGSLFYPDNRAFFEGLNAFGVTPEQFPGAPYLNIPFTPAPGCDGLPSDVAPIWQPEFFGNVMVVNGQSWPYLEVEQRRYRFRLLNGCNSRFLILDFSTIAGVEVWQIGASGGFLAAPVDLAALADPHRVLLGPAERADVIVDFTNVPLGNYVLANLGPDEPFGGGTPGVDFDPADPATTGQVMEFRVGPASTLDTTTPPADLELPPITQLVPIRSRDVSLNEQMSKNIKFVIDSDGNWVFDCAGDVFGPTAALLGTLNLDNTANPLLWMDPITENPGVGDTEEWVIYNFTADAHPIHIHLIQFQVVNRQQLQTDAEGLAVQPAVLLPGTIRPPEAWETGFKDTVLVYPGEVTRVKARFDIPGLYVWHCHIVEHEDNEMMRPYQVGP